MVVVAIDFPPSRRGVQTYLEGLCRHLAPPPRLVLAPAMKGDRAFDATLPFPVRRIPCPARPQRIRAAAFVLQVLGILLLDREGGRILCAHWWCAVAGWILRALRGRRYAVMVFGIEMTSGRGGGLRARVLRRAERVLVLSEHTRRRILDTRRIAPGRVRVVSAGIDANRFAPRDREEARARLGMPGGPLLLSIGSLAARRRHKGQDTLLAAVARLAPRHPSLCCAIVGTGARRAELESLARELSIEDRVRFLGEVDERRLLDVYAACDVLVHPVRVERLPGGGIGEEGFGYVVLEAMACGRAVVTSRGGSVAEVAGDAALLTRTNAAEDVARAVERILEDPREKARLEQRARARAAGVFGWREAADRVAKAFAPPPLPRVAFLSPVCEVGGAERSLLDLLAGRKALGVDPVVLIPGGGPLADVVSRGGVRWIPYPLPASLLRLGRARRVSNALRFALLVLSSPRILLALRRILREEEVSILHTNGIKAHLLGTLAAPARHVRVVWHVRDLFGAGSRVAWILRGIAVRRVERVMAISHAVAREWCRGNLGDRVRVVANGIDLERFHPDPAAAPARRDELGLPRDGFLFICVGMFAPWKGQDVAIESVARLRETLPGATLVLVGDSVYRTGGHGGEREAMQRLARRLGVAKAVRFAGFQEDVRPWLWAADAAVHTSRKPEPFGRVLVEAMACGLPVVATRGGGPEEIVREGETGELVAPGDPRALAAALERLARDPSLRERMGLAGRRRAEELYGRDRMAAATASVYREMAAGGEPCPAGPGPAAGPGRGPRPASRQPARKRGEGEP